LSQLKSLIARIPLKRWSPIVEQVTLWATRLALLWLVLSVLRPSAPRAMLGDPQTVETIHADVCVHTRLIDEAEEWKIQRTLQLVREMGATTIVEFFPWAYAESQEGVYNWFSFDRIVRNAHNQGLKIIARMGLVPAWARPPEYEQRTTLNTLPQESYDEFARFVAIFAERYAGDIDHIIIWNEPNLAFEWGYASVDPSAYVRLLQAVYAPAHEANPNVEILAGALAPTIEPEGSPNGLYDILYLQAMYEAGAADYFDALAVHTYGFTEPPDAEPAPDLLNFRRAELLRQVMEDYGDAITPVYITETGWNDSPRWTKAVRPSLRIAHTIDAYRWAEQQWSPWLQTLCVWAFRFPTLSYGYPDNFALVGTDFQLRPIYYALQAYARGWQMDNDLWLPPPVEPPSP
jgi:polysaccharide biosynthesis protein PslG